MNVPAPWLHLGLLLLGSCLNLGAGEPTKSTPPPKVDLTAEEEAWVAAHPAIRVGFSPSFPPYSMPNPNGQMEGIDLDYLALISARTRLRFVPVVAKDWPTVEAEFQAGRLDLLTALIGSTRQRETMRLSRPYMHVPMIIVSRTTSPYLLQVADLQGLLIGTVKGTLSADGATRVLLSSSRLREYDTLPDLLQGLARGEVDATLADAVVASYNIRALHLSNLRMGSVIEDPYPLFFGMAQGEPLLAGIMDKAIASLTTEEKRTIDERWVSVEAAPSKWLLAFRLAIGLAAGGTVVFLLLFLRNRRLARELEERRRLHARLEEANARLSRVSEQKTALMRMVAHDIRSPLTGIVLATDCARQTPRGEEGSLREIIEGMRSAAQQLHRLASDLVDAQTTEDGYRIYNWARTDVRQLLDEVTAVHAEAARRKQVRLHHERHATELSIITDAAALRQVIDNLVSNAVKYTRPGTEVRVGAQWAGDKLRLEFSDQGPGIKPEDLAYIFLRYGKGAARPTGGEKSTGLGLWIVESLVTGLHGWVQCESTVGQGSIFSVELPPAPPPAAPSPVPDTSAPAK